MFPQKIWTGWSETRPNPSTTKREPDFEDWRQIVAEIAATQQKVLDVEKVFNQIIANQVDLLSRMGKDEDVSIKIQTQIVGLQNQITIIQAQIAVLQSAKIIDLSIAIASKSNIAISSSGILDQSMVLGVKSAVTTELDKQKDK